MLRENSRIIEAMQAAYEIGDPKTRQREIDGLLEAAETYNIVRASIITLNQEEAFKINGVKIKIVPAWKWLLELS